MEDRRRRGGSPHHGTQVLDKRRSLLRISAPNRKTPLDGTIVQTDLRDRGRRRAGLTASTGSLVARKNVKGDGDGIYCEALLCPCATGKGEEKKEADGAPREKPAKQTCSKPRRVQNISFSKTEYPNIRRHFLRALRKGWPRTLVLNRRGADARRDRLLDGIPTRSGYDRDEYPPAVGRGRGPGLMRGINPLGWMGDVKYVPSSENRSHGSTMGIKLRRFCNGTRFRYVFY